jgi:hypothetical protein
MSRAVSLVLAILLSTAASAAEYMEKAPFQLSRAFSPGVTSALLPVLFCREASVAKLADKWNRFAEDLPLSKSFRDR